MQTINELQLAKELIRYPSITPIDAGVMKFLEKQLRKLGFKTKILEFKEKNTKPVKNLYARLGTKGPNFCYAGHLDVVPAGNLKDWTVNPFRPSIKKGHLIGRGANDMKSSIAAFVSAVSIFVKNNKKFDAAIICASGGGLAAGTSIVLKNHNPKCKIYTAEPAAWNDHQQSFAANKRIYIKDVEHGICDALESPVPGKITFAINNKNKVKGVPVKNKKDW